MVKFNFVIRNAHTKIGENVHIVGSIPQLGNWKETNSTLMKTSPDEYPCWSIQEQVIQIDVNDGIVKNGIEYKYLIKNKVSLFQFY